MDQDRPRQAKTGRGFLWDMTRICDASPTAATVRQSFISTRTDQNEPQLKPLRPLSPEAPRES